MPGDGHVRRRVLAAPDSYKGTAGAAEMAGAIARGADAAGWDGEPCPLSDGGEGFAAVLAGAGAGAGGRWIATTVTGPLGAPVAARWWLADTPAGAEAMIESASASGLTLAGGAEGNDPMAATTRGTGELLVAAARAGARRALLGVGGSATTDGGRGALDAIDAAGGLGALEVVVACDVDVGFVDAAARFGPQKGASPEQVAALRDRLSALAAQYRARSGVDVGQLRGAGAAGGLAGGLATVGARLVPGFEVVADAVGLRARIADARLVVTGEGRLDSTSWSGKVVGGVLGIADELGRPALVVAGSVEAGCVPPVVAGTVPEVIDLTARFGAERARAAPALCVTEAIRAALAAPS